MLKKFIVADDDTIISRKSIIWIKRIEECMYICTKSNGCNSSNLNDTHKVCRINNPTSYNTINNQFLANNKNNDILVKGFSNT
jgi:hypothetical protein